MIALLFACTDAPPSPDRPDPGSTSAAQSAVPRLHLTVDLDHDGFTVDEGDCDDSSAEVRPGADETCNGRDDDCDGSVDRDDSSVDLYSCGYCPDPALFDETQLRWTAVDPCDLDPAATCTTHVHRRVERVDGHPLRDELLLFLPPGPGAFNETILQWGAWSGYRVLSLGWLNDDHHADCLDDEQCVLDLREEQLYGVDTSPYMDIAPNDAIVGRMDTLLRALITQEPNGGWDRYWSEAEGIRWDQMVVVGWSWGSGQGAYVAQRHEVAGLLMISGPQPASWLHEPSATPGCAKYALYHELDELGGDHQVALADTLVGMGLEGPPVNCDAAPNLYDEAQILTTVSTDFQRPECSYHSATAYDGCIDAQLITPYAYLYCSAADTPKCE